MLIPLVEHLVLVSNAHTQAVARAPIAGATHCPLAQLKLLSCSRSGSTECRAKRAGNF
jgi:hypothetical protein